MIKKVLIANRGEIALRIIRSCQEMGIKTVAIYSTADELSLHRRFADEDICIGKPDSNESYLNVQKILCAVEMTGADAIHPGYGFLSENMEFAQLCEQNKIQFIGPKYQIIHQMGEKTKARQLMQKIGIPILEGSDVIKTPQEALQIAKQIGFPILIKSSGGGGGKGMRIIYSEDKLLDNIQIAQLEAQRIFKNPDIYLEKYITSARHIEVQILGDNHGNYIHLGERDCSIQRKNQKLLEEAPCSDLSSSVRKNIIKTAIKAAKSIKYTGAGTIEFVLDSNNRFYFIEMNTRIQVEHPVTEMCTNLDIVKEQIYIAQNKPLSVKQNDINISGHAIECRINAENPSNGFFPSTGKIEAYHCPGGFGIRMDSHIYTEYEVSPYYDSLLGKLIVWGKTRQEAIRKMRCALDELIIIGVDTTIELHKQILDHPDFIFGNYTTDYLNNHFKETTINDHQKNKS